MSANRWTIAKARARLGELIERAHTSGPQTITRNGRDIAVVLSTGEWEGKTRRKGNLAEFLCASPLRGSGLSLERSNHRPRDVKL